MDTIEYEDEYEDEEMNQPPTSRRRLSIENTSMH